MTLSLSDQQQIDAQLERGRSNMHAKRAGAAAAPSEMPLILLIGPLAGSMILPSISGVILCRESYRRRAVGITILAVSVAATVAFAVSPLQL